MPNKYQAFLRIAKFYYEALRRMNKLYREGGDAVTSALPAFNLEWQNIEHAYQWVFENAPDDYKAAILCCYYPDAGALILNYRQNPQQRIKWLKAAFEAAQALNDKSMEAIHSGNLGLTYNGIGENRVAAQWFEKALKIAIQEGKRRQQASQLGNLGMVYTQTGDYQLAIDYLNQCYEIMVELDYKPGQANALANLGQAFIGNGNYEKQMKY